MTSLLSFSSVRALLVPSVCAMGLFLTTVGCDLGAARDAVQSVSPTVSLPATETTVSGRAVDAASGTLLSTSAALRIQGPNSGALMNMYGEPVSALTLYGGTISLGIRDLPSREVPVRFRVLATADGYQSTSESVQLVTPGTKQFRLDLLSEDPSNQPEGAFGSRQHFEQVGPDGRLRSFLFAETPTGPDGGNVGISVPKGTALYDDGRSVNAPLVVDLVHYTGAEQTLEVLPGDGAVAADASPRRFLTMGYLNRQIQGGGGADISSMTAPNHAQPTTWVRLSANAIDPSSRTRIQEGDQLELFRFDTTTGTWHPDTTVTVRTFSSKASGMQQRTRSDAALGIRWPLQRFLQSRWWAWGRRSRQSCVPNATMQVDTNGQFGNVDVRLRRPGLQYRRSISMSTLSGSGLPFSTVLGQSAVPRHEDYTLTLQTRDGQSRTVSAVNPCGGATSISLPPPTDQTTRTDVLVKAIPECPASEQIRLASAPTVTVYYRALGADGWNTAGSDHVTWIMDDPEHPTYIKRAELTLNGLKQGSEYEFTTTYGQDRYDATIRVPQLENATVENGRVVVKYDRPLSNICS